MTVAIDSQPGNVGHIVALIHDRFILDMSLDQASRPAKGIIMRCGGAPVEPNWSRARFIVNGCFVCYWPVPDNQEFRKSNDWRISTRTTPVAKEIIRQIEKKL